MAVGEAALRFVELERGDAEVEQDAVCDTVGVLGDDVGDLVVDGVDTEEAVTEAGQPLTGERQGLLVAVDPDHPGGRAPLQDRLGVATHPERAVDAHRTLRGQRRCEEVDDAVPQHRNVPLGGISCAAHRGPSGRRCWGGGGRGVVGGGAGRPGWRPAVGSVRAAGQSPGTASSVSTEYVE